MKVGAALNSLRPPDGAPVPRVAAWYENPVHHEQTGKELLNWLSKEAPIESTMTPQDRLPNGLASGMMAILVDWEASRPDDADSGFHTVHNVTVGGSAVLGRLTHATVKIPTRSIQCVEYVIVKQAVHGPVSKGGHGQLRFVFDPDNRPKILGPEAEALFRDPYVDDLIMSWEAWRPPLMMWDYEAGLDPKNFTLTARLTAGHVRFTNDALRSNFWHCYPLALPEVEGAADTVLHTALLMGDALMRRVIGEMVDLEQIDSTTIPDAECWSGEDICKLKSKLSWDQIPDDDAREQFSTDDISYHLLERSCIALALAQIDFAMEWIHQNHDLGPRRRVNIAPDTLPEFFDSIVAKDRKGALRGMPEALEWFSTHQTVLPGKSFRLLEDAGLLKQDDRGKTINYVYDVNRVTPYGRLNNNLMM
jgi:hypothetical protein